MKNKLKTTAVSLLLIGTVCFGTGMTDKPVSLEEMIPTGELPTVVEIGSKAENINAYLEFKAAQKAEEERQLRIASRGDTVYFRLSESERRVAECIVQGEAGGEDLTGKMLVAQCLLNGCLESNMQPSEVRIQYRYSGWKDKVSEETKQAVRMVFDEGHQIVDEPILYFYAPKYVKGKWHETQTHVITHGCHKFFMRNQ